MSIRIAEDAKGYNFLFTCIDGDGNPLDLTGSTITLYLRLQSGTTRGPFNCTTSGDPIDGVTTYVTDGTEIDTGGNWTGQLKYHTASKDIGCQPFSFVADHNLFVP